MKLNGVSGKVGGINPGHLDFPGIKLQMLSSDLDWLNPYQRNEISDDIKTEDFRKDYDERDPDKNNPNEYFYFFILIH